jgi:hypothetical protein
MNIRNKLLTKLCLLPHRANEIVAEKIGTFLQKISVCPTEPHDQAPDNCASVSSRGAAGDGQPITLIEKDNNA